MGDDDGKCGVKLTATASARRGEYVELGMMLENVR